ncbi:hypothetical protein [Desulfofalx alkaliphila]|uniref:hypothetical protein n=1 Tax=Desulfofalx alkaliphila TaxID=105483 RepID=UPI0004E104B5|nr:hypothetical protein [Desulfofalx alkaliphila]
MQKQKIYHLQYLPHKPVSTKYRWAWRPVNRVQEWLEGEDKPAGKVMAYSLLALVGMCFAMAILEAVAR